MRKRATTYGDKLRDPRWQRKRLEILWRDDFTCRLCSDKESTLHVHHLRYDRGADPWDYPEICLVTLCEACHEEMHVAKFGENIIEAAIAGGARLEDLHGLVSVIQMEFSEGPNFSPMTEAQWSAFIDGITAIAAAARDGWVLEEIVNALRTRPNG